MSKFHDFVSIASGSTWSIFLPLEGVLSCFGLFASELSSSLSPLPGWLPRREVRLRVIYATSFSCEISQSIKKTHPGPHASDQPKTISSSEIITWTPSTTWTLSSWYVEMGHMSESGWAFETRRSLHICLAWLPAESSGRAGWPTALPILA